MNELSTAAERLISLILAPFTDERRRAEAEQSLRELLTAQAAGHDTELEEITARIERADHRSWPLRRWRLLLAIVMLAVSVPFFLWSGARVRFTLSEFKALRLAAGATRGVEPWRAQWESEPDNPALLARFALAHFSTHQRLSPEIVAAARRVDPDNGWFVALEAASEAKRAVTAGKLSGKDAKANKPRPVRIEDGEALGRTMALLREARTKPAFRTYQADLHRRKMASFSRPDDYAGSMLLMAAAVDTDDPIMPMRNVAYALAASAQRCAERGDAAGFDETLAASQWLWREVLRESDSLMGQLLGKALAVTPLRHFRDAAEQLGRDDQAATFAAMDEAQRQAKERATRNAEKDSLSDLVHRRGHVIAKSGVGIGPRLVLHPPEIREEDLRPGRLTEHAVLDRLLAGITWAVLGVCACVAWWGKSRGCPLAARLTGLLDWRDGFWIVLAGILAPVAWFAVVTRFTPLSARDGSVMMTLCLQPGGQHFALRLLLLLAPLAVVRWRLGRKGSALGWSGSGLVWDGSAIALAALAVPVLGLPVLWHHQSAVLAAFGVLLGLPLLWMVALAVRFCFARRHALWRAAVGAAVAPAWVFVMLLCGLALPFHEAEERHWTRANHLFETPADRPVPHRYEASLVDQLRAETTDLLAPLQGIGPR